MRESGEALVAALGVTQGHEGARPRLRRRHDGAARGAARRRRARRRHRAQPGRGRQPARARSAGSTNCASRKATPATCATSTTQLRPRRQHLRRHVRAQAVRRGQGDGARHQAGRPHRHGQLDPERSDAGRADPEDQLRLHAAAARRLRQPDDLGRREPRDRALRRPPALPKEKVSFARDTFTFEFDGTPAQFVDAFRHYYGPTMNAFDAAEKERPRRRAAGRAGGAVREPEQERPQRPRRRFRRPSCA